MSKHLIEDEMEQTISLVAQTRAISDYHLPVLPTQVVESLQPCAGRIFVDGTLGGGGHAKLLLEAGATVIGIDQDEDAIHQASNQLHSYGKRFIPVRANFTEMPNILQSLAIAQIDGVLLDIGVSSYQLDTAERGFSFQQNGLLDMRMDRRGLKTAADLLNSLSVEELTEIFKIYGEEPKANRVATQIEKIRIQHPFCTTFDLVAAVEKVIPRTGPKHPATRIFQALRIAVNDELGALTRGLETIIPLLTTGGCLAVITFHSLEDRIVKHFFRDHSTAMEDRPEWPAPRPNPRYCFCLSRPTPLVASTTEIASNPRSRSAKLRVAKKTTK